MKNIKVNVRIKFKDMSKYSQEFQLALINEMISRGVENLDIIDIEVDKVRGSDISYDYSRID